MQTITIDIINEKALRLLQDLELLQLIRLRKDKIEQPTPTNFAKYKGILSQQPLTEVDQQLHELRNGWE